MSKVLAILAGKEVLPLEHKTGKGKGAAYYALADRTRFAQTLIVESVDPKHVPESFPVVTVNVTAKGATVVSEHGTLTPTKGTYQPKKKGAGDKLVTDGPERPCLFLRGQVDVNGQTFTGNVRLTGRTGHPGVVLWAPRGCALTSWQASSSPGRKVGVSSGLSIG